MRNSEVNFGDIKNIVFLGGGMLVIELIKKIGIPSILFSSKRHLEEKYGNKTFKEHLIQNNIEFHESENINSDKKLKEKVNKWSLGISISAAWIIKKETIDLFQGKLINTHGSNLPTNRGGGGMSWRIMQRNKVGAAACHLVSEGIDDGLIISKKTFIYSNSCKVSKDFDDENHLRTKEMFLEILEKIKNKENFEVISQQEEFSSYFPRLNTNIQAYINWSWCVEDIVAFIDAFDEPYNGSISFIGDKKARLKGAQAYYQDGSFHPFQTGIIYRINSLGYFIATKSGTLIIQKIEIEGGYQISVGDRLFTPQVFLESAMQERVVYTAKGLKNEHQ